MTLPAGSSVASRLRPFYLHVVRNFAIHLESGADLPTIQIPLSHRDLKVTARYIHLSQWHLHAPSRRNAHRMRSTRLVAQPHGRFPREKRLSSLCLQLL